MVTRFIAAEDIVGVGFSQNGPMILYFDSTSTTKHAKKPVYHQKNETREVDCHFVREKVEKEDVMLVYVNTNDHVAYVNTNDHVADSLTKAVNINKFNFLSKQGNIHQLEGGCYKLRFGLTSILQYMRDHDIISVNPKGFSIIMSN